MDERFPDEFVTWHHKTPIGVKVDEVFGMEIKNGRVWLELAKQIYCEQGEPNYREINHFSSGVPYLENYPGRISITHTDHFLAVAMLPKTPEINLEFFNPRSSMGIDAERTDRKQVLNVRQKFLSENELEIIPEDNLILNVQAWTIKEALYKAALTPGIDIRKNLQIKTMPLISENPLGKESSQIGIAYILFPKENGKDHDLQEMKLYSYISYGNCVSIAISSKCATYGKDR